MALGMCAIDTSKHEQKWRQTEKSERTTDGDQRIEIDSRKREIAVCSRKRFEIETISLEVGSFQLFSTGCVLVCIN